MGNKGRSLRPLPARPPRRTQKAGDCSGFWEALKGSRRAGGALFFSPALERWPQAPGLFLRGGGLPLPFGKLPACGPCLRGRPDAPKKQGIAPAFGKPSRVPGAPAGRFFFAGLGEVASSPGLFLRGGDSPCLFESLRHPDTPCRGPGWAASPSGL